MLFFTSTAVKSAALKVAANLTAQLVTQYRQSRGPSTSIDWHSLAEFAVFGLVQGQLNDTWQHFLEDAFPTSPPKDAKSDEPKKKAPSVNWRNVMCKLALDQTLGLLIMNTTFLVCTNMTRVEGLGGLFQVLQERLWRIIRAAWKIWPVVAVCNFLWVPVDSRVVVASCVGFAWNIFLTLTATSSR